MSKKEKVFNEKIEPLLDKISKICEDEDIQSLCVFGLGNGKKRTTSSTYTKTENEKDFNPVLEAVHQMTYFDQRNKFFENIYHLIRKSVYYGGFTFHNQIERTEYIAHPKTGDMVIEVTNPYSSLNSIGKLIEIKKSKDTWDTYIIETL
ncbi:MAG: hypothetical protein ACOCP8_03615, partial [archaeon]